MNRSTADFTPVPTSRRIPSWLRANLLDKTEQPHMRNMHYENLYCRSVPAAFTVQVEITFLTKCSTSFKALNAEILQILCGEIGRTSFGDAPKFKGKKSSRREARSSSSLQDTVPGTKHQENNLINRVEKKFEENRASDQKSGAKHVSDHLIYTPCDSPMLESRRT